LLDAEVAMRIPRVVVLSVVALLALGVVVYGATVSPAEAPYPRPVPSSLGSSRFFVLLPDGGVEITDAWSRRVFRWDGHRWAETESRSLPRPDSR
jgi:hypothetical protein